MTEEEAVKALDLVQTLPGGKRAIKNFVKTLNPKEAKTMFKLLNILLTPFDALNSALERMVEVVYSNSSPLIL